ncbi:MAG TPA: NADH-quinone oxidoreductase subunit NuoG [Actinomycetota bacterium]|nr:NADH-quinone oxidoreductase subunit NuoG [Actinomycetota bacterium]
MSQQENGAIRLTLNGREVEAPKGRLLIDVAEEHGVFIPRFCYHPGMASVAVCRMCLVKVEGQNKLLPACATQVDDGMVVDTVEEDAVDAQRGMLEFLLINHPLDCPICDRAGECPLQDQTYKHGPGSTRYVEDKRKYEKALAISELVVLDRERCVLCWRCVRFSDEIAGDAFIQLVDRGAGTQILTFTDEPFDSYFSGNTIQICPVGALTSKPYRFVSRPWDLETAPSVCSYCSVGCPITNEQRAGKVVRCQALPNEEVNSFWICDKGRFGYHYLASEERLKTPLVRGAHDEFEATGWGAAIELLASKLKDARVGVIAGGHLTTEDAYAIGKLAKKVIKTPHVDSRLQDAGTPYERVRALAGVAGSTATFGDLDSAETIVWAGPDPKETLPVAFLRVRGAVMSGRKLIVVSARASSLDVFATEVIRTPAGGEAAALRSLTDRLTDDAVICWGPSSPGRAEDATADAAIALAAAGGRRLLVLPPHAGSQGMIDMGVLPMLDAGYKDSAETGMDTLAILEAAAAGELDVLLLFGADPIADFPDRDLARRALSSKVFTAVVEILPTESVALADVVLPAAAYAERDGTFTNLERRIQKLEALLPPPGSAMAPWRIAQRIAAALDEDWGWSDFHAVWADIKKNVTSHASVDAETLAPTRGVAGPEGGAYYDAPFLPDPGTNGSVVAGPGGQYPKGHRAGAPFQSGQNWPLSWELRSFEARQRPGFVPEATSGRLDDREGNRESPSEAEPAADADAGALQLYTGRFIYDSGAMVSRSAALLRLAKRPFVEMNSTDAARLGLAEGDLVTITSGDAAHDLELRLGDVGEGVVFVPYDQPGFKANELMTGTGRVVTVAKASAPVAAESGAQP